MSPGGTNPIMEWRRLRRPVRVALPWSDGNFGWIQRHDRREAPSWGSLTQWNVKRHVLVREWLKFAVFADFHPPFYPPFSPPNFEVAIRRHTGGSWTKADPVFQKPRN